MEEGVDVVQAAEDIVALSHSRQHYRVAWLGLLLIVGSLVAFWGGVALGIWWLVN